MSHVTKKDMDRAEQALPFQSDCSQVRERCSVCASELNAVAIAIAEAREAAAHHERDVWLRACGACDDPVSVVERVLGCEEQDAWKRIRGAEERSKL